MKSAKAGAKLLLIGLLGLGLSGAVVGARGQQPTPAPTQSPPQPAQKPMTREQLLALGQMLKETNELFEQAMKLEGAEKYDEALPLAERILLLFEQTYGPEDKFLTTPLVMIARLHEKKNDYRRAEPFARRALAVAEKSFAPDDPNLTLFLSQLAAVAAKLGDYERAAALYERKAALMEKAQGADSPDLSTTLVVLADVYRRQANYARAEQLLQRALTIREKAGAQGDALIAPLDNLASVYVDKGNLERAEQLQRRALSLREQVYGPNHFLFAVGLLNGANIYREQGDFVRAEQQLQRALPIFEQALGASDPKLAILLNNLAGVYKELGDLDRAEALAQRVLAIDERVYGAAHVEVARDRYSLGDLYRLRRDYARAEQFLESALALREQLLGAEHPDVAASLNSLGLVYSERDQPDYARAGALLQRALAIREKVLGPAHPLVGTVLNNMAGLYQTQHEYARAVPLYERALAIQERVYGPRHPDTALMLGNVATLYEASGEPARALALLTRAGDIREENLALILTTGSERRKQLYMATLAPETNYTVSLHLHALPADSEAARLAASTILRRKGRALDAMTDQLGALRRRLAPDDQRLLDQLSTARAQLAALLLQGGPAADPTQTEARAALLRAEIEQLETQASARSAEFRAQAQPVTLAAVQRAVPAGAALVEFVLYRPVDAAAQKLGAPRYAAYVVRGGRELGWLELGEAAAIDQAISDWRATLADPRRADVRARGRALDEQIMRPLRRLLGDTRRLFLSPDGALNLIPFAALVDEQDRYLAETYAITYLTSGRDLLRLAVKTSSRQGPAVFADPDFDAAAAAPNALPNTPHASARRSVDLAGARFPRLPGTAAEARVLAALLPAPHVFTRAQATEGALKQVAAPLVLHVATHGFFLPAQQSSSGASVPPGLRGLGLGGGRAAPAGENPLLRSGLALAGANRRADGAGGDGVLTAYEAAALDLFGTRLVVLSACETGLGDVQSGDGVYGLRRALVLAGAESQMMSLWQVSDAATRDLMTAYYRRLLAGGERGEALRQVQLAMIKRQPQAAAAGGRRGLGGGLARQLQTEERRHPFYWASFILSGEWRALDDPRGRARR